jgi:hypothetical protein
LKKALMYFDCGIVLGILITLIPLITLAEFNIENRLPQPRSLSDEFRGIEGSYGLGTSRAPVSDLAPLVISFVVAMVAYLLVRRRIPGRYHGFPKMVPS